MRKLSPAKFFFVLVMLSFGAFIGICLLSSCSSPSGDRAERMASQRKIALIDRQCRIVVGVTKPYSNSVYIINRTNDTLVMLDDYVHLTFAKDIYIQTDKWRGNVLTLSTQYQELVAPEYNNGE
jgi:hypothetical protein